jgi:hypothetical protein
MRNGKALIHGKKGFAISISNGSSSYDDSFLGASCACG